ncbi:nuclear transport factor 2 family protein [Leptolyngbya sp. PCC 6406]|uniref:nuclear transport factor 2 family protein n=1 Tax=Leptolyngbya sp. PCC 6406 TaxID=1173264 RepID=UPI0002ACBFD0|nr:nuclear transport factor 2 family protein [Leptolyngbya sp. PCC 6406]
MADDRDSVLAAHSAFYRAFEKKNLEAMEKVWSQGTESVCIHPGRDALKGWGAIRESWAQIFKNTRYLEVDVEVVSVTVQADLAAVVAVENVLQISDGQRLEAQSMATNILERLGDRWYLIHHHGSPVMK